MRGPYAACVLALAAAASAAASLMAGALATHHAAHVLHTAMLRGQGPLYATNVALVRVAVAGPLWPPHGATVPPLACGTATWPTVGLVACATAPPLLLAHANVYAPTGRCPATTVLRFAIAFTPYACPGCVCPRLHYNYTRPGGVEVR